MLYFCRVSLFKELLVQLGQRLLVMCTMLSSELQRISPKFSPLLVIATTTTMRVAPSPATIPRRVYVAVCRLVLWIQTIFHLNLLLRGFEYRALRSRFMLRRYRLLRITMKAQRSLMESLREFFRTRDVAVKNSPSVPRCLATVSLNSFRRPLSVRRASISSQSNVQVVIVIFHLPSTLGHRIL